MMVIMCSMLMSCLLSSYKYFRQVLAGSVRWSNSGWELAHWGWRSNRGAIDEVWYEVGICEDFYSTTVRDMFRQSLALK
ncbi:hypothetical protein M758_7G182300 [Ceratodon purpureus]|uniref:Uncharacterized protein n=1 Tax=Ceratodon purpureus TaxID=3225 RepID=A0A8T0H9Y0_CERPU|nr:hypothetical protein KC19_7G184700 [Ceratodon purpureus]KAG0611999.1 hypothetical protein M758_7G182300 [Ceratodon purpureus]